MNLVRQIFAVFLSVFLSFSAFAADDRKEAKEKNRAYPYFKLGIRPINPSGVVDWGRECVVTTTEDSPPVRLYYKSSNGSIKLSAFGVIKAPEAIIVSAKSGFALRPKICGNGLGDPMDWIPVGVKKCAEVPKVEAASSDAPKASSATPNMFKPFTVVDSEYKWGLKPEEPKKLDLGLAKAENLQARLDGIEKQNKKMRTTLYVVGGVLLAGIAVALICSSGGGSSHEQSGGPAPDPPNSVFSVSW